MAKAAQYSRTGARTANLPGRRFDHVFFTSMALVMLVTVFVGFAHTYYLAGLFQAPLPSRIIHIHGAVFSCWILLLVAQTSLVSAGRVDIHQRLGMAGFFLGCLMICSRCCGRNRFSGSGRAGGPGSTNVLHCPADRYPALSRSRSISPSARAWTRPRTSDSSTSRQLRC